MKSSKMCPIKKSKIRIEKEKKLFKVFRQAQTLKLWGVPEQDDENNNKKKTNKKSQTRLFYIPFKVKIKGTKDNIIYNSIKT